MKLPEFVQLEPVGQCNLACRQHGVARVWENDAYNAFRARLASDDPPEICRGCAIYNGTF